MLSYVKYDANDNHINNGIKQYVDTLEILNKLIAIPRKYIAIATKLPKATFSLHILLNIIHHTCNNSTPRINKYNGQFGIRPILRQYTNKLIPIRIYNIGHTVANTQPGGCNLERFPQILSLRTNIETNPIPTIKGNNNSAISLKRILYFSNRLIISIIRILYITYM